MLRSPPARAALAAAAGAAGRPLAAAHTPRASAMLSSPAVRIVPGRPIRSIRKKPLARTPIAAPKLLVK
jgi:hypothetical protein